MCAPAPCSMIPKLILALVMATIPSNRGLGGADPRAQELDRGPPFRGRRRRRLDDEFLNPEAPMQLVEFADDMLGRAGEHVRPGIDDRIILGAGLPRIFGGLLAIAQVDAVPVRQAHLDRAQALDPRL